MLLHHQNLPSVRFYTLPCSSIVSAPLAHVRQNQYPPSTPSACLETSRTSQTPSCGMFEAAYATCTVPDPSTFSSCFDVPCQFSRSRVAAGLPGYWLRLLIMPRFMNALTRNISTTTIVVQTFIIRKNKNKASWVAPGRACNRTLSDQNSTLTHGWSVVPRQLPRHSNYILDGKHDYWRWRYGYAPTFVS